MVVSVFGVVLVVIVVAVFRRTLVFLAVDVLIINRKEDVYRKF